jgi:hypothetical protein
MSLITIRRRNQLFVVVMQEILSSTEPLNIILETWVEGSLYRGFASHRSMSRDHINKWMYDVLEDG